jgi:F-type H+-transporting ATPase subunit alpha
MELLKQQQYSPYPMEDQVVSIWAGLDGQFDDVPVADVQRFERELLEHLRRSGAGILQGIRESKVFDDSTAETLRAEITEFKKGFQTSEGKFLGAGREEHEPLDSDEVAQERIVAQRR